MNSIGRSTNLLATSGVASFKILIVTIFFFFLPLDYARADWMFSQWGMSIENLKENAPDEFVYLEEPKETRSKLLLIGHIAHEAGDYKFQANFLFSKANKLDRVVLTLSEESDGATLCQSLLSKYGEPKKEKIRSIDRGESHIAIWHDEEANNVVSYFGIGENYTIEYAPLDRTAGNL